MFTKIQDLHVKTPKSAHRERTLRGTHRIRHAQSDERLMPTNVRISPSTARTTKGETSKWVSGTVSRGLSSIAPANNEPEASVLTPTAQNGHHVAN